LGASDPAQYNSFYTYPTLSFERTTLENMFRGSWIVDKAISVIPEDMMREDLEILGEIEPSKIARFIKYLNVSGVNYQVTNAIKWGRLYGGAIAYIDIKGQMPETPLKTETVIKDQLDAIKVYDRYQATPSSELVSGGLYDGLPMYYDIQPIQGAGFRAHYTRCARFIGKKLPKYPEMNQQYWGDSVIAAFEQSLKAYELTSSGLAALATKAHLRMMKVKGLRAGIALDASDVIYKYFDEVRKNQGVNGMTLLDSEDEYQSDSPNFGGAGDIMLQFVQQLSGSLGIPMVRLYGQSPTGLSSTGESDLRTYYDEIKRLQETILSDPLERILRVAYQSCFGERVPEDFDFKFKPLWQMSESEKSTLAATDTNTIIAAFNAGLVSEEIALKELKQSSNETGIWTNITDEYIESVSITAPEPVLTEDPING
jgi:hypothetical protein